MGWMSFLKKYLESQDPHWLSNLLILMEILSKKRKLPINITPLSAGLLLNVKNSLMNSTLKILTVIKSFKRYCFRNWTNVQITLKKSNN